MLEDLSNGVVYVEGNFLNDKADYACDVGYKMAGQNQRICEKDGTWSGEPPKCNSEIIPIRIVLIFTPVHCANRPIHFISRYACNIIIAHYVYIRSTLFGLYSYTG